MSDTAEPLYGRFQEAAMINLLELGMRVRTCRKENGLTTERLSEMADISPFLLRSIERGSKGLSIYTLASLSEALHVSSDYLLFGSEENSFSNSQKFL